MTEWNRVDEWVGIQIPSGIEAAFCPGAGPADNSCSSREGGSSSQSQSTPRSNTERWREKLQPYKDKSVWSYAGENDQDPDVSDLSFKTSSGREFFVEVQDNELSFVDDKLNIDISGKGEAHEVFSNVLGASSKYLEENEPEWLLFRAYGSKSRIDLYDRLAKAAIKLHPEYRAFFKQSAHFGGGKVYRLIRKSINMISRVLRAERDGYKELSLSFSPGDVYADFEFPLNLAFCPTGEGGGVDPTCGAHGASGPGPADTGGGRGGESPVSSSTGRAAAAANPARRQEVFNELADKHLEYVDSLNDTHPGVEALDEYVGAGHEQMNELLRFGKTKFNYNNSEAYFKNQIENLDNLIESAPPIPKDVVVARGAGTSVNKNWKVGDVIEDRGFMSTSFSEFKATAFSRGNHETPGALLKILVPKGMKGLVPPGTGEDELILQRGTRLKIIGVKEKQGKMGYFGRKVYKVFYAIARRGVRRAF